MTDVVSLDRREVHVVSLGGVGPPGPPGSGGGGEVFALDVVPTSTGIVGSKTYEPNTTPPNVELHQCLSDTPNVRVLLGCEGGADKYSPSVTVNGVAAVLTESTTKRWFTGYADITLSAGINTVNVVSDAGGTDTVIVEVLGAGPEITSITFGPYPGTQTELKAGDQISVTVHTDADATQVTVLPQGATAGKTLTVTGGVATGVIDISANSGNLPITARARNSFGTYGNDFQSSTLVLNQTTPTITNGGVSYPSGQQGLNTGDTGTVNAPVSDADTVIYSSTHLSISNPNTYEVNKTVQPTFTGYEGSGWNYTITAHRAANDTTTTANILVRIATVAPTAYIMTSPAGRMVSSPTGIDYEVRVYPDQLVSAAPTLNASVGAWQGSWTLVGSYWKRLLRISDAVARGVANFSGLSITGPSGIAGSTISSGSAFTVGGFSSRTLTIPAFSRVVAIGVNVGDETKVSAQIVGGATLTRYTDSAVRSNGFYISDASGNYSPTGGYLALSDTIFAGSNTSGTLQVTVQEVA